MSKYNANIYKSIKIYPILIIMTINIKKTNHAIFKPKQKSVHMSSQISFDSIALKHKKDVLSS